MARSSKGKVYAYVLPNGRNGVVQDWTQCEKFVHGVANARYRGFSSQSEAEAWLSAGAKYQIKPKPRLRPGIYFDAGTGRGNGVEISVTDEKGKDLLELVLAKNKINRYGKHKVSGTVTNNYGELLALKYALQVAEQLGATRVYGDSKLVIEYWSRGVMKAKELPPMTVRLVHEAQEMRRAFEVWGGSIERISGDNNPADLGFH